MCTGTCKLTNCATAWLLEAKNGSKDRERDKETLVGTDGEGEKDAQNEDTVGVMSQSIRDCDTSSSSLLEALSHDYINSCVRHEDEEYYSTSAERLSVSPSISRYACQRLHINRHLVFIAIHAHTCT